MRSSGAIWKPRLSRRMVAQLGPNAGLSVLAEEVGCRLLGIPRPCSPLFTFAPQLHIVQVTLLLCALVALDGSIMWYKWPVNLPWPLPCRCMLSR